MKEIRQHGKCCNFDDKNAWCDRKGISVLADEEACKEFGMPKLEGSREMENKIIDAKYQVVQERTLDVIATEIRTIDNHVYKVAIDGAIEIGRRLDEAKSKVGHGNWENWCKENLNYSKSQAERFMKLSEECGRENSPYLTAISKTYTCTDFSISKAFRLLQVPEEEVENFVEENNVSELTVKELEETIKGLKLKSESSDSRAKELEEDLEKAEKEKADYIQREKDLADQLNGLKESSPKGISEEAQAEIDRIRMEKLEEIKQIAKEKESAETKTEKLKNQIEQLKKDQEQIVAKEKEKAAAEAKAQAKKENEEELQKLMEITDNATKAQKEAEKKLAASSNEDMTKCKIRVGQMQEAFNDAVNLLAEIEKNEPDQAAKLRAGLKAILGKLQEQL